MVCSSAGVGACNCKPIERLRVNLRSGDGRSTMRRIVKSQRTSRTALLGIAACTASWFPVGLGRKESSGAFLKLFDSLSTNAPPCKMRTTELSLKDNHGWRMLCMQWVLPFDLSLYERCIEENKTSARTPPAIMWSSTQGYSFFFLRDTASRSTPKSRFMMPTQPLFGFDPARRLSNERTVNCF